MQSVTLAARQRQPLMARVGWSRAVIMRAGLYAVIVAVLFATPPAQAAPTDEPPAAHAAPTNEASSAPGAHHREYPNLIGFRIGHLGVSEPKPSPGRTFHSFVFLGLSYERTLIHRWLEAEISVPIAIAPGEEVQVALPMDVHLKVPFHPAHDLSPYVAVGPSVDLLVAPEVKALFGVSFALGTYVWFNDRVGVDVEIDYNLVFEEGAAVHELLMATGPVMRF